MSFGISSNGKIKESSLPTIKKETLKRMEA